MKLNLPLMMLGDKPAVVMYPRVDWLMRVFYWFREM